MNLEIFSRLNKVGIEVYSIDKETQNLHAELFNRQFKKLVRLFRSEDFKYLLVVSKERERNLRMVQSLLRDLMQEVLQQKMQNREVSGEKNSRDMEGIFKEKSDMDTKSWKSFESNSEEVVSKDEIVSKISGNLNKKKNMVQRSINTLVQNIYKQRSMIEKKGPQSNREDSLRNLMIPKQNESTRELSKTSDKSEEPSLLQEYYFGEGRKKSSSNDEFEQLTNDQSSYNEHSLESESQKAKKTALKNIKINNSVSPSVKKPFQSTKTLNTNKHKKKPKNKKKKIMNSKNKDSDEGEDSNYKPMFMTTMTLLHNQYEGNLGPEATEAETFQRKKNLFGHSSRESSEMRDSDTQSFASQDTEEERELLRQVDFELSQFEKNKDQIRQDFQKNFIKMFNAQQMNDSMEQCSFNSKYERSGEHKQSLTHLQAHGPSGFLKGRKVSQTNQTIKQSGEHWKALNQVSKEDSQNVTQSTNKVSGMTCSSYSLRQIDKIYNELINEANNIPSGNVSWKNSSLKTDLNSRNNNNSDLSSFKGLNSIHKQK